MTTRKRWNYSPEFKAKVAIAALKGDKPLTELAQSFDVHSNQIKDRESQLFERSSLAFGEKSAGISGEPQKMLEHLVIPFNWGLAKKIVACLEYCWHTIRQCIAVSETRLCGRVSRGVAL